MGDPRRAGARAYAWGPFHRFWVRDPKRREIRAAPFRDRVVHHTLFNVLDPVFQRGFIADSYAYIPGRGTHHAVERYRGFVRALAGRGYRVQGDIRRTLGDATSRASTTRC